ncbi:Na(+)-translocating NADH-quinone reductase subunit A [Gabonibacter massiliensis]|uniref:Na(+)-translocating NADH-quinone reductase subunit A n=1 Tax=Gabonibacter massiliensis TaxID=1720195 RepID=UPI00073EC45E|nr:Na(+)-translocating NADH-quinone reductase subunit A [Gabonibacter massiliensis]
MSKVIKLKKGLDIKLKGEAEKTVASVEGCNLYAVKPTDFRALTPKLMVKAGNEVKAGDVLFSDKYRPEVQFTAPVSGIVDTVNRGERRKLLEIVIKADAEISYKDFGKADVNKLNREEIISKLLESGIWPMIKQRPYDVIANPETTPKAIFISGFDSAPLAPDFEFALQGEEEALQTGIDCLKKLCNKKVYLNLREGTPSHSIFAKLKNVEINYFSGPHPAGNVGIQIHHLDPINKGDIVWVVNIMDVAIIGRLFLTGHFDARKIIALVGSEVKKPAYYKTILGANIGCIVKNKLKNQVHQRIISGNVLTGYKVSPESFLGYYNNMVTVIPEGDEYEFLGWATPGFNKFSMSKTFPSFLFPNKKYALNANYHGEERAFVVTGQYEKVLPMDILPVYLLKAVLAEDLDKMEQLGMYEIAPEDLALCEFVCTSKTPVQQIVEQGIELMMKELS